MARREGPMGHRVFTGRHVKVFFKYNYQGMAACAIGPELSGSVMEVVRIRAKRFAESIAPRSDRQHRHYADSFGVELTQTGLPPDKIGIPPMLRACGRLFNYAPHAAAVEFGNQRNSRGQHILRRTLEHLGPWEDPPHR